MPTDEDEVEPTTTEEPAKSFDDDDVDPEEVGRWRKFARRLMDRGELMDDTRDLLTAVLTTSDKAKSEIVRMTGREVRHYLEGLAFKEGLLDIATNYKLEVNASFHLQPIAKALRDDPADRPAAVPEADED